MSMERIDITLLERHYSLACQASERAALQAAVNLVDQRTQAIKHAGKTTGNERIAVMAAIQIASELLALRAPDGPLGEAAVGEVKQKLDAMHRLLDQALGAATQIKPAQA